MPQRPFRIRIIIESTDKGYGLEAVNSEIVLGTVYSPKADPLIEAAKQLEPPFLEAAKRCPA